MTACPVRYSTLLPVVRSTLGIPRPKLLLYSPRVLDKIILQCIEPRQKTSDRQKDRTVQNRGPANFCSPVQMLLSFPMSRSPSLPFTIPIIVLRNQNETSIAFSWRTPLPVQKRAPSGATRLHPQGKGGPAMDYIFEGRVSREDGVYTHRNYCWRWKEL